MSTPVSRPKSVLGEDDPIMATALALQAYGIPPVPLRGKIPCIGDGWKSTADAAVADAAKLRAMFAAHTGCNIGALHGRKTIAVDVDGPVGREELAELECKLGPLPRLTWRVQTGRADGGEHRYCSHERGAESIGKRTLKDAARPDDGQLEIFGDGQTVAPPSIHPDTGALYRWLSGCSPSECELAPLPEAWAAHFRKPPPRQHAGVPAFTPTAIIGSKYVRVAFERECAAISQASQGARNDTLNRAAFNLGQFIGAGILGRPQVEAALTGAGLGAGLGDREVAATIRSGIEAGMLVPRMTLRAWVREDATRRRTLSVPRSVQPRQFKLIRRSS